MEPKRPSPTASHVRRSHCIATNFECFNAPLVTNLRESGREREYLRAETPRILSMLSFLFLPLFFPVLWLILHSRQLPLVLDSDQSD